MILSKNISLTLYTIFSFFIMFFSILLYFLNKNINFYGYLCGLAAFSSIFFVLEKVAMSITRNNKELAQVKPSFFQIFMGLFLKFILPVGLIWVGVVQIRSTASVFVGAFIGLVSSVASLYVLHRLEMRVKNFK